MPKVKKTWSSDGLLELSIACTRCAGALVTTTTGLVIAHPVILLVEHDGNVVLTNQNKTEVCAMFDYENI